MSNCPVILDRMVQDTSTNTPVWYHPTKTNILLYLSWTPIHTSDITPVTTGGKLVVCGSILAGVAIIPGQAAALFEALLESDKQRAELERDLPLSLAATSTDSLDSEPQQQQPTEQQQRGRMLDPVTPCGHCGTTLHWVDATYCWSCGKKLEM
jgi:hypothetical protein